MAMLKDALFIVGLIVIMAVFCAGIGAILGFMSKREENKKNQGDTEKEIYVSDTVEKKEKKKTEHSKLLTWIGIGIIAYVLIFASIATFILKDMSAVPEMIIGGFGVAGFIFPFYFNKAKSENKIKLMKENGVKPDRNSFEDQE